MYGVEANCKAFEAAGLMAGMPPVHRDALYIYEVLKTDASRDGHTYVSFPDLRQHWHWAHLTHAVSDWSPALTFLAQNGVTREERFDSRFGPQSPPSFLPSCLLSRIVFEKKIVDIFVCFVWVLFLVWPFSAVRR